MSTQIDRNETWTVSNPSSTFNPFLMYKKPLIPKSSLNLLGSSVFKKDVRFGWGLCNVSSVAEILVNPTKSISLGGSVTEKKVFVEGRHYFDENHQGSFLSLRASSRGNLGFVVGSRDETDYGTFTTKIGVHTDRSSVLSPVIGLSWEM